MFRIAARTADGRNFFSPWFEDDSTLREEYERFTHSVISGDLPEWLSGKVDPDDLEGWGTVPGPGFKPPKTKPGKGAVNATVAVWPEPPNRYAATPANGPFAGNAHAYGETEQEALTNAAIMLDGLRGRPDDLEAKSNISPEELESIKTKPEEKPGIKYFRVEVERGNRFTFAAVEAP